jgi:hypothetical protein
VVGLKSTAFADESWRVKRVWLLAEVVFFAFAASSGWKLWRIENTYAAAHPRSAGTAHALAFVGLGMVLLSVGAIVVALRFVREESRARRPVVVEESRGLAA